MILSNKKRILNYIKNHYGENPVESFTAQRCRDRIGQIRILYDTFHSEDRAGSSGIDDVTWSDLEMDEVFLRMCQKLSHVLERSFKCLCNKSIFHYEVLVADKAH